jgi:hypothetical protein
MSVGEEHAARRETIDIRSSRLRVSPKATDPVVEIVDYDEEHIRRLSPNRQRQRNEYKTES